MRVLQINYSDHYRGGGAAIAMHRLNSELNRKGVECSVLSAYKTDENMNSEQISRYHRVETILEKITHHFGLRNIHPVFSTYNIKKNKLYKEADIIHLNILHNDYFSYPLLPILTSDKPAVYTIHDMWSFTGHCTYSYDCERWKTGCGRCPYPETYPSINKDSTSIEWRIKNWAYRNSNITFVADSSWLAEQAKNSMLGKYYEVHHIPYGLNTDIFKPRNKTECRKLFDLPADKNILMFSAVDFNDYRKGGDLLVEIIEKIPDSVKKNILLLTMGGEAEYLKDIKGVEYRNLGYLNDDEAKATLYSASDIFIMTSRAEAFGIVLMESISCGTPVVAFNVGGVDDVARHEITGLLAKPMDTDDFRDCLIRLLNDAELRSAMSDKCRATALREYKIECEAGRYIELFEHILRNKETLH